MQSDWGHGGVQHKASLAGPRAATPWSLQRHKEGCRHPGLVTLVCQHSEDGRKEGMHRLQACLTCPASHSMRGGNKECCKSCQPKCSDASG